jgi:hypothetical protein
VLALVLAGLVGRAHTSGSIPATPAARAFSDARSLHDSVLRLALNAAACARRVGAVANDRLLTVIDYSKASTEPRLWVLDLERERVLFEELVAPAAAARERDAVPGGSHQTSLGPSARRTPGSSGYCCASTV